MVIPCQGPTYIYNYFTLPPLPLTTSLYIYSLHPPLHPKLGLAEYVRTHPPPLYVFRNEAVGVYPRMELPRTTPGKDIRRTLEDGAV
jgi:hypothetical protein